jgi:cellobiose-specific phosphotransferase system component IIA
MGDADKMLGQNWIQTLQHIQAPMILVHGANHFMDAEHEFDLLEHTLDFLQKLPPSQ